MKKIIALIIVSIVFVTICLAADDPHPPTLPTLPLEDRYAPNIDSTDIDSNYTYQQHN